MRGFGFGGILGVAGLECRGFRVQVLGVVGSYHSRLWGVWCLASGAWGFGFGLGYGVPLHRQTFASGEAERITTNKALPSNPDPTPNHLVGLGFGV